MGYEDYGKDPKVSFFSLVLFAAFISTISLSEHFFYKKKKPPLTVTAMYTTVINLIASTSGL
jgi:hypothetical protein